MKFVLSGGGTAGHINPALALAEELQDRGHDIFFAGTPQGVEARLVPEAGISFTPFEAAGFNRNHPLSAIKALRLMLSSTKKAKVWLVEKQIDGVVCFGGYVSIPVGRAAEQLGIPIVIHEQNSVMGMANKMLSKQAQRVCLTYMAAADALADTSKVVLTGNPVRKSIFDATREAGRMYCEVPDDATMLLVFGGSLGARHINTAVCAAKEELLSREHLYIRHLCGPKEYDTVVADLALTAEEARRWQVIGYEDRMGDALAASDLVVARAGATSLAEIAALKIPALLVPFPYATADHQSANARSCVECGAAFMVADDKVETDEFTSKLFEMIDNPELRARMKQAAEALDVENAAIRLADTVCEVVGV